MAHYLKSNKYLSERQRADIFLRRCGKLTAFCAVLSSVTDVKEAG